MASPNLTSLTLTQAAAELRAGHFSAGELTDAYLNKINQTNPTLNAYLEVFADEARQQAAMIDEQRQAGATLPPLAGLPLAIKDNILIAGHVASGGSKILADYRASYSATVIAKLQAAGAIFLGRTNMDEFAMGSSTETSAWGPTKNPVDPTRVPGGSSGGSAAALGAELCLAALGSDTGGSIRQPAAFCGVVGLKPTYGAVSRYGLMALASSLDQIGPFTKTVADAELMFQVIKGRDDHDATSRDYPSPLARSKLTIGVPWKFFSDDLDPIVLADFQAALKKLAQLGYAIKEVDLPNIKSALACYYIIQPAEASANLARYDGLRYGYHESGENLLADYLQTRGHGFGREVRRRIMLGTYVLSAGYYDAYYGQAERVRQLIKAEFNRVLATVDLIATPTTPSGAFRLGEKLADPLQMYLADIFTVPANIAGLPAIAIPSGRDQNGLPLSLQLLADAGREDLLFAVGQTYEHSSPLS